MSEKTAMASSERKMMMGPEDLKKMIREIPDYPKPGILFYDITTLIKDRAYLDQNVDLVLGMEARGFIFGPAMAYRLNAGFIPVRKAKKLPGEIVSHTYDLEYGTDTLEIHKDAIQPGQRVLIVDDLLATGGTAEAAAKLATKLGADICGLSFVVELDFLNGRRKLAPYEVFSLLHYAQ
jgi:adenine phosphoribosyltransferase